MHYNLRKTVTYFVSATLFTMVTTVQINATSKLRGKVSIDGSSTVYPITEAIAEEFRSIQPRVRVNIGVSGSGGGFKKFSTGRIDISNASRTIKAREIAAAQKNKINFLEVPIAFDGISIVVNKTNTWANDITTAELKNIWDKDSTVKTWNDVRKSWPKIKIQLFGPGTDSGTFDYFTKAINGKERRSRSDYMMSEDDNILVQGIANEKGAMGYFGFAYYEANQNKLKALSVNGIRPTQQTIKANTYAPLARPIFIYVNKASYQNKASVKSFVDYYLENVATIVRSVGYVALPESRYRQSLKILNAVKL